MLLAVSGKENGQVYHAAVSLDSSASAKAVLRAAAHLQAAYSRLPLLLSPSNHCPLPADVVVELTEDTPLGNCSSSPSFTETLIELPPFVKTRGPSLGLPYSFDKSVQNHARFFMEENVTDRALDGAALRLCPKLYHT